MPLVRVAAVQLEARIADVTENLARCARSSPRRDRGRLVHLPRRRRREPQ